MNDTINHTYSLGKLDLYTLYQLRNTYSILPACQREKVWKLYQNQLLIDSVFRNIPIPPIAYIETKIPLWGIKKELFDGQQRFTALMDFFEDKFSTAKEFRMEVFPPLYPGKKFSQLSKEIQDLYGQYKLEMLTIEGMEDRLVGLTFRRWQSGTPLTLAEKLYSHDGVTKRIAENVTNHRIWRDFYSGVTNRKNPFQAGIKLMILETNGVFSNMTTRAQNDMLLRTDYPIDIPERISRRLDLLIYLYDRSIMQNLSNIILTYQSIMLLEENNYSLQKCDRGCLTDWFMNIQSNAIINRKNGVSNLFGLFDKVYLIREFWVKELQNILVIAEKGKLDRKRLADINDKLILWNNQKGRCGKCGKDLRFIDGVMEAHHLNNHSDGGVTELENLILVHQKCHHEIHSNNNMILNI